MGSPAAALADIVVVYNPQARGADERKLQRAIRAAFGERRVDFCQCSPDENMAARLAPWLQAGARLVIAAGGDGTVSDVAAALINTPVTLGILPLGTSNVVARDLRLPINAARAARLLAGDYAVRTLDVLKAGETICLIGVGAGLSASAMQETERRHKRMLGTWAYWVPYIRRLFKADRYEFRIRADGFGQQLRASDVLVMNCASIGFRAMSWGKDVRPDDGQMNLCFISASNGLSYAWVIMNFFLGRYLRTDWVNVVPLQDEFEIVEPVGLPVQGDGDVIGVTPFKMKLIKSALKVAVIK
jgi:diacylglycerol kinase family enzyme